jgi:hypothetical protein
MLKYPWIEYPLIVLAVLGPLLVMTLRFVVKKEETKTDGGIVTVVKRPLGIGVREIQLIALLILVPAIAILSFECKLSGEGTGTLLGAIVGYVLSGITSPVPRGK